MGNHPKENGEIGSSEPESYGDNTTYVFGAEFLSDCESVEDWGCGRGWARQFFSDVSYVGVDMGVDGQVTDNPFADKLVDLTQYTSDVDGILLRHVLEHNYEWRKILANALASAKKKVYVVTYTEFHDEQETLWEYKGIPTLRLPWEEFRTLTHPWSLFRTEVESDTYFGKETIVSLVRVA